MGHSHRRRERIEFPVICPIHAVPFVRFTGVGGRYSMGCPQCVAKLRADVRAAKEIHRRWSPLKRGRKPKNRVPDDTGDAPAA